MMTSLNPRLFLLLMMNSSWEGGQCHERAPCRARELDALVVVIMIELRQQHHRVCGLCIVSVYGCCAALPPLGALHARPSSSQTASPLPTEGHTVTNCPKMKFLQVAIFATILVASAHAIACNVGTAVNVCPSQTFTSGIDTCSKCVVKSGGQTAVISSACSSTISGNCDILKNSCASTSGTYTSCTTDNCNGCSPASALQLSVFLLLAALSAMFF